MESLARILGQLGISRPQLRADQAGKVFVLALIILIITPQAGAETGPQMIFFSPVVSSEKLDGICHAPIFFRSSAKSYAFSGLGCVQPETFYLAYGYVSNGTLKFGLAATGETAPLDSIWQNGWTTAIEALNRDEAVKLAVGIRCDLYYPRNLFTELKPSVWIPKTLPQQEQPKHSPGKSYDGKPARRAPKLGNR